MIAAEVYSRLQARLQAADPSPSPQPFDPDKVEPGLIGLAFFLVMAVAVFFLVKSMRNRLSNIDVERHGREQEAKRARDAGDDMPGPV